MSVSYTIDISEALKLAETFPQMINVIADEARKSMLESGLLLTTMVAARTPVNLGFLRASINFPTGFEMSGNPFKKLKGHIRAGDVGAVAGLQPQSYVNHVEFGTRPHWPPLAPIVFWAARKFQLSGDDALAAGRAVQAGIAAKGTKGAHMFERAWKEGGEAKVKVIWRDLPIRALRKFGK